MANRHLSRSIVLQTLFEWDFRVLPDSDVPEILARNMDEFAPGHEDAEFIKDLTNNVVNKKTLLDEIIMKAAPQWPIEKIASVDKNVLRIGLVELLFADKENVPPKVAINESIELAKRFGGESSGRFINGVLGAVYREMGEPGKDDSPKNKVEDDPSKYPIEQKVGALVYGFDGEEPKVALVHDVFGYWTFSKGGLKDGEDQHEGLKRKITEEIGIDISPEVVLGELEYIASHPEKGKIRKVVTYFLAKAKVEELKLKETGGLDDVRWFTLPELAGLTIYDDLIPMLTKAIGIISK